MIKYYDIGSYKFSLNFEMLPNGYYELVVFDIERKDRTIYWFLKIENAMEKILSYVEIDADDFNEELGD